MKKIVLLLMSSFVLFSCSDQEPEVYSGENLAYFTDSTEGAFYVQNVPNPEYLIEVGITNSVDYDRSIEVSIDPSSDATASQYTIDNNSLFIPAGSHIGYIKVLGDYANSLTSGSTLVMDLVNVQDGVVAGFNNRFTLTIYQFCDFVVADFLGAWDADEVGYAVYTSNFTAGTDTALNEIVMSNIWDVNPSSQTKVYFNDSDPSNFVLDFPAYTDNYLYNDATYGPAYVDRGEGTFSACAQTAYMTFQVRVSAGFFSPTEIYFSRP